MPMDGGQIGGMVAGIVVAALLLGLAFSQCYRQREHWSVWAAAAPAGALYGGGESPLLRFAKRFSLPRLRGNPMRPEAAVAPAPAPAPAPRALLHADDGAAGARTATGDADDRNGAGYGGRHARTGGGARASGAGDGAEEGASDVAAAAAEAGRAARGRLPEPGDDAQLGSRADTERDAGVNFGTQRARGGAGGSSASAEPSDGEAAEQLPPPPLGHAAPPGLASTSTPLLPPPPPPPFVDEAASGVPARVPRRRLSVEDDDGVGAHRHRADGGDDGGAANFGVRRARAQPAVADATVAPQQHASLARRTLATDEDDDAITVKARGSADASAVGFAARRIRPGQEVGLAAGLPDGWFIAYDDEGDAFYFRAGGAAQWERPTEPAPAAPPPDPSAASP